MVRNRVAALALFAVLVLLSGCLVKKTEADCQSMPPSSSAADRAMCYHEVAVIYALKADKENAYRNCMMVDDYSQDPWTLSEKNNCFVDIATILLQPSMCDYIEETIFQSPQNMFGGIFKSYRQNCLDEVNRKIAEETKGPGLCKTAVSLVLVPFALLLYSRYRSNGK